MEWKKIRENTSSDLALLDLVFVSIQRPQCEISSQIQVIPRKFFVMFSCCTKIFRKLHKMGHNRTVPFFTVVRHDAELNGHLHFIYPFI